MHTDNSSSLVGLREQVMEAVALRGIGASVVVLGQGDHDLL